MRKAIVILYLFILAAFLMGCKTMKATPAPSEAAMEYRAIQEELHTRQTETAITGVKIEDGSREIVAGLDALETAMAAVPEADPLLPQVQALRVRAGELQGEAVTLNRQLAAERENSSRLEAKYNDYESIQVNEMALKDTKINTLEVENKKITGQRNTLLAIVITAITVIVLIIAVKVLRAMRIIPI
jgi:hypothetical protein